MNKHIHNFDTFLKENVSTESVETTEIFESAKVASVIKEIKADLEGVEDGLKAVEIVKKHIKKLSSEDTRSDEYDEFLADFFAMYPELTKE